ncbi:MAG: TerB family tellurite resistance protein [Gelidibacter sp.]
MKSLEQLKKELLADGIIDAVEVKELKEVLYADGVIDTEEAEFLFEINDAVSGKDNDASWESLFINAITSFLLEDEASPGEIDEEEAEWLFKRIKGDGQIDEIEKNLLLNLKDKAKSFPENLESLLK